MTRPITSVVLALHTVLSRAEFSTLAALGVLAGALYAFVEIADEVIEGDTNQFDEAVLRLLGIRPIFPTPSGHGGSRSSSKT